MDIPAPAPIIDTHCHLDFKDFDIDRDQIIANCRSNGLVAVVNVGSTLATSKAAVEMAAQYDIVYACVGCHPHDADSFTPADLSLLEELCSRPKVVGIGETGLDYYHNLSTVENQRRVFEAHIDLARRKGLPLVVHTREAQEDTLAVLDAHKAEKVIIHCFAGDEKFLKACIDRGYYISFTCNITYKKAANLRQAAAIAPLERICVETDAPYLSPEGRRGKRNEPVYARAACDQVAVSRGMDKDEAARATTANARKFFNI
ncbi:MAG: TatD family hydrolase [Deltaproteobacteria bacterium]